MVGTFKLKPWVIAGLLALSPAVANSAGLGKLTVLSALGQPLRAEIELLAVQANELDSIVAKVASADVFRSAGVERSSVMSDIRFSVEQKTDGSQVLKMSTVQAVNDPFLDVLVELNWASGRLLREYTALMDPVGFAEPQAVHPVEVPIQKSLAVSKPAAKPLSSDTQREVSPSPDIDPSPKPVKKPVKPADPLPQEASASESYAVKHGDTLSTIARKTKPQGYSLEQMLVALYQTNKESFSGGNMNRLSTGKILRIPKEGEIAAIGQAEAIHEIKTQTADWNAYRQKLATTVAEAPKPKEDSAKQAVSGKITTAVQDKTAPAPTPSKDVLKVTKGEAPTPGKDVQALQGRLQSMQEDATAREKTIKEANDRIASLEKSVKEMQQLLELKNKNLSDLQKQAAAKPAPAKPEPAKPAPAKPEPAKPEPAKPEPAKPEPAKPEPAKPEPAKPEPAKPVAEKAVEPKPEVVAPAEVKQEAVPAPEPMAEPDLIETLLNEPLYLAGGAGALLLAGGALVAISRRRKKSLSSFEDSILTGGDLKANTVFGETAGGVVDTGDTSFLTDFSQAGLGSIDTNDVDPIAEAEVYMAYGRDAQAEEILKEAQAKDPNRHEIHLKLLEIYASRKNLIAFETLAGELYASVGGQGTLWDKAAELGRSLDPMNPLYAAREGAVSASDEDDSFSLPDSSTDMSIPTHGFEPPSADESTDFGVEDSQTDFNLDAESPEVVEDLEHVESENETLEFDMGALTSELVEVPEAESPVTEEVADNLAEEGGEALEFDMGSLMPAVEAVSDMESAPVADAEPEVTSGENGMDFDLDALVETSAEIPTEMADSSHGSENLDHAMDFSLDFPVTGEVAPEAEVEPDSRTEISSVDFDSGSADITESSDLDFNFEIGTGDVSTTDMLAVEPAQDNVGLPELDLSGINLDLNNEAVDTSPQEVLPATAALSDLDLAAYEGDEAQTATKLDLARAYVEMGDKDGAKEILEEVLKEGNAQQQADANQLLASF